MKSYRAIPLFLALALALGACTLPSAAPTEQTNANAVFTAAAQTVEVKLTQNALTVPTNPSSTATPSPSPMPQDTQTPLPQVVGVPSLTPLPAQPVVQPTAACDAAQFMTDVTVPDGTAFNANDTFTKTWRLKNVGTCTWNTSYSLFFDQGDQMGGSSSVHLAGTTAPGQTVDISVNLQAPKQNGNYTGYWGLMNASGTRFAIIGGTNARSFYVQIRVGTGTTYNGGTPNPTNAPDTTKFAVVGVHIGWTHSGNCTSVDGKYVITADLTVNKAGTVTYYWVINDGNGTTNSATTSMTFDSAGSQSDSYTWQTTITSGAWVDLYVDKPNHFEYQRANLHCP